MSTPGLYFGLLIVTRRKVRLCKVPFVTAWHRVRGTNGQHRLHGCAAHKLGESLCCAGPIQMGHCSGEFITMSSYRICSSEEWDDGSKERDRRLRDPLKWGRGAWRSIQSEWRRVPIHLRGDGKDPIEGCAGCVRDWDPFK